MRAGLFFFFFCLQLARFESNASAFHRVHLPHRFADTSGHIHCSVGATNRLVGGVESQSRILENLGIKAE